MKNHDKISFTREYCKCRRIPYSVKGEALYIDGFQVCFSLLNLDYAAIVEMIDKECGGYDSYGFYNGIPLPF